MGWLYRKLKYTKKSFRFILISSFLLVSVLPVIIFNIISYYQISVSMKENTDQLMNINLVQTRISLNNTLSSYDDLLFQMYTNDEIIEIVKNINTGVQKEINVNKLRRKIRSFSLAKPGIQCITIITKDNKTIFYDRLTSSVINSSWLDKKYTQQEVYTEVINEPKTVFFPTQYAINVGSKPYYVFHIGHQIVNYRRLSEEIGTIIISIDENVLNDISNESINLGQDDALQTVNYVVDSEGYIVSCPEKMQIGNHISKYHVEDDKYMLSNHIKDEDWGIQIYNYVNQTPLIKQIHSQQKRSIFVVTFTILILISIIIYITNRLSYSIQQIVNAMKQAEKGVLSVRLRPENQFSREVDIMAKQFNKMMDRINGLISQVKEATFKQKEAEIRALEAQITPHFLYNTLDNISWVAIDNREYQISDMIVSLAKILRYSIDRSNNIVNIEEEIEWLKRYMNLQQIQEKKTFTYTVALDRGIINYKIRKMLLQPFVENAIIHGFREKKENNHIQVNIGLYGEYISIHIHDNGSGISQEILNDINKRQGKDDNSKHIGISNAIGRIKMYYGEDASVCLKSKLASGTDVFILIPKI